MVFDTCFSAKIIGCVERSLSEIMGRQHSCWLNIGVARAVPSLRRLKSGSSYESLSFLTIVLTSPIGYRHPIFTSYGDCLEVFGSHYGAQPGTTVHMFKLVQNTGILH